MDNELILQRFEEAEQKIERLIEKHTALLATTAKLKSEIERLEGELKAKTEAEDRYEAAKTQIRSKIDTLLVKLKDVAEG